MERSVTAKSAKSVFFEEFNDIDIFIEDTSQGYVKIFEEILGRVFESEFRISKIFPLGGKTTVIDEHSKHRESFSRPTLYIVDGDLDLIHFEANSEPGLYHLPYYCIENLLLDENGLLEILNEEDPITLKGTLIEAFDYVTWRKETVTPLADLFIDYGICYKKHPPTATVSYEVKNLISSNSGLLDLAKVEARKKEIVDIIKSTVGEEEYNELRRSIEYRVMSEQSEIERFISGKDYLLPLLLMRIRMITKTKTPSLNIKSRLAMKCNIEKIQDCKRFVGVPG